MLLVLGADADPDLDVAAEALGHRGLGPIEILRPTDLAHATFVHRFDTNDNHLHLRTADGRVIDSMAVAGTLNRLTGIDTRPFANLAPADARYAISESFAALWGWLATLPGPLLNPPGTFGLAGERRHPAHWATLAAQAGVPTRPWRSAGSAPAPPAGAGWVCSWVVGPHVVADPGVAHLSEGCRNLAAATATPLVRLGFDEEGRLGAADAIPPLAGAPDAVFDALAAELSG